MCVSVEREREREETERETEIERQREWTDRGNKCIRGCSYACVCV